MWVGKGVPPTPIPMAQAVVMSGASPAELSEAGNEVWPGRAALRIQTAEVPPILYHARQTVARTDCTTAGQDGKLHKPHWRNQDQIS